MSLPRQSRNQVAQARCLQIHAQAPALGGPRKERGMCHMGDPLDMIITRQVLPGGVATRHLVARGVPD